MTASDAVGWVAFVVVCVGLALALSEMFRRRP